MWLRLNRDDIVALVQSEFQANPPARIGVAVSGGSDSLALLHVLARVFEGLDTQVFAVTVDHGLRPEAAEEARFVAQVATALDVPHDTLKWEDRSAAGNLQARARDARYDLMTEWAREKEIAVLALGHTADDQAETVLMRIARSSGVDGLAGIARRRIRQGITLVRPLLDASREDLRSYLTEQGQTWIDDPSNEDHKFERVRMRAAAPQLRELGLTTQALSDVAANMSSAKEALDWYTFLSARESVQLDGGDVLIDQRQFRTFPDEIARRLLVQALCWIGGGAYQPRRDAVKDALTAIRASKTTTLHGCLVMSHAGLIWVCREYKAVQDLEAATDETWDRRWRLKPTAKLPTNATIRALGELGLTQCENWRETGRPHAALMSSPSVWDGDHLIAAPMAGRPENLAINLTGGGEEFFAAILSH